MALISLGSALASLGKLEQAKPLQERGLAINEGALSPDHVEVARAKSLLGNTLRDLGELTRAQQSARGSARGGGT